MGTFDELKDKAVQLAKDNSEVVESASDTALDKAAEAADSATGGKFSDQISSAKDAADGAIGG